MHAQEIIATVESLGGSLLIEGESLRLRAPVAIPTEVKEQIRSCKDEILELLCKHAPGCPHSTAYLVAEYQRAGKLRIEYEGKSVWLVRTEEIASTVNDGTVYTMSEWRRVTELSDAEIRTLHGIRSRFGGTMEIKE